MRIQGEADPDPDDVAILERGVAESTVATTDHDDLRELAAFVRDDDGTVRGGVYGLTWGGCCELQYLWVHPSVRGRGFGRLLLEWAENEARGRGCRQVVLLTHASQTPDLYGRRGYELAGRVDDYPVGDAALWFRKGLDACPSGGSEAGE